MENRAAQLVSDQEQEQTGTCKCVCTILCLFFWFSLSEFTSVCSFIFHFNYGEDNSSVCANSAQTHTLLPRKSLYIICRLFASCIVCFTPQVSCPSRQCFIVSGLTTRGQQSPFKGQCVLQHL